MRVCSWNINSIRARMGLVERYLRLRTPDVLLLQETKAKDSDFPTETFAPLGYHTVRAGQPSYNGVAILSRFPLSHVKIGLRSGDDPAERRFIRATVEPPGQAAFTVGSVYVPNGKSLDSPAYPAKLAFLDELKVTLSEEEDVSQLILGGDFNVAFDERDVFDPTAMAGQMHFTMPEREQIGQLLGVGLVDTLRARRQEAKLYSWWDYRMQAFRRNRGLRIDYLFAGHKVAARITDAQIDREPRTWEQPSDHAPTLLDFDWQS